MEAELLAQFLESIPSMTTEKLVKLYIKTRAAKSEATKAHDVIDAQFKQIMEACENNMIKQADAQGVTGFSTPFGTTYTAETSKISIADDAAFFGFVKQVGDLDFFERRVSVTHVQNYMKLHGDIPPPGLNIFRERTMRVRKATEKAKETA